jgi:hypothetical protein
MMIMMIIIVQEHEPINDPMALRLARRRTTLLAT